VRRQALSAAVIDGALPRSDGNVDGLRRKRARRGQAGEQYCTEFLKGLQTKGLLESTNESVGRRTIAGERAEAGHGQWGKGASGVEVRQGAYGGFPVGLRNA
jgi:hypothetical protein